MITDYCIGKLRKNQDLFAYFRKKQYFCRRKGILRSNENMTIDELISECTAYDFKLMLEEKRPKSWLKSVSAFANGMGGSLFFGVGNDGVIVGLNDIQSVTEKISSTVKERMDPLPDFEAIPHKVSGLEILEIRVQSGKY